QPSNDNSVIIDGQSLEILTEVRDDLGNDGIERVVFYVNDVPLHTSFSSYGEETDSFALDNVYGATIHPPEGVDGFALQAIAYDVLGHSSKSQVVHVGRIDDTVKPDLDLLYP